MVQKGQTTQRLRSLDAFRGFDMFFIMGGDAFVVTLATLFPIPFFKTLAGQMAHVPWNGLSIEDLIFPTFLFISGISFPFSLHKQRERNIPESEIYAKIIRRGLILVLLGIVYNGLLAFDFSELRYASVLGRIGIAWMFAALITVNTNTRTRIWVTAGILLAYWLLMCFVSAPDAGDAARLTPQGNFAGYIDRLLLPGRLHNTIYDPEGLLSTLPAICTALLGIFTGEFIRMERPALTNNRKVCYLLLAGLAGVTIGLLWNIIFPINKNLWTSSFVCCAGGISTILFALFYYLIDVRGWNSWTLFFTVIGMNSLTIYLAQSFISFSYTSKAIFGGAIQMVSPSMQPVLSSISYIAICWVFLYFLYRKEVFLKV